LVFSARKPQCGAMIPLGVTNRKQIKGHRATMKSNSRVSRALQKINSLIRKKNKRKALKDCNIRKENLRILGMPKIKSVIKV